MYIHVYILLKHICFNSRITFGMITLTEFYCYIIRVACFCIFFCMSVFVWFVSLFVLILYLSFGLSSKHVSKTNRTELVAVVVVVVVVVVLVMVCLVVGNACCSWWWLFTLLVVCRSRTVVIVIILLILRYLFSYVKK
jgi:hypothetical protein